MTNLLFGWFLLNSITMAYFQSCVNAYVVSLHTLHKGLSSKAMCIIWFWYIFQTFAQSLNTYTILLLNIDRYILVKYNVLSKTWCTPRRAVIHFIFIVIGSLIFSVPKFIEYIPAIRNEKNAKHCEGYFKMRKYDSKQSCIGLTT